MHLITVLTAAEMSENNRTTKRLLPILPIALLALMILSVPAVHATQANWQTTFSGTMNLQGKGADGGSGGFWGWCSFSGGTGSPALSGTDANCEAESYSHSDAGNFQVHSKITGTAWDVEPSLSPPPPGSGVPTVDFFITAGTMSVNGPAAAQLIDSFGAGALQALGCTVYGNTVSCDITVWESLGIYNPDTGIPAGDGHWSLKAAYELLGLPVPPGSHINFQVNQKG